MERPVRQTRSKCHGFASLRFTRQQRLVMICPDRANSPGTTASASPYQPAATRVLYEAIGMDFHTASAFPGLRSGADPPLPHPQAAPVAHEYHCVAHGGDIHPLYRRSPVHFVRRAQDGPQDGRQAHAVPDLIDPACRSGTRAPVGLPGLPRRISSYPAQPRQAPAIRRRGLP